MDHEAIKNLLKQIPTMKSKPLSHDKIPVLLTDIGSAWYLTHLSAWDLLLLLENTNIV